jgi:hypothetical protein
MEMRNRIWRIGFTALAAAALLPVSALAEYSISSDQVSRALGNAGIRVDAKDVSLSAEVVSSKPGAVLKVLEIHPAPAAREMLLVRIACQEAGACLPFSASVKWSGDPATLAMGSRHASAAAAVTSPPCIGAGAHAMLVITRDRSQIQISVLTLQSGSAGQVIRVATPDRKQIYRAKVIDSHLLEGTM